MPYIKHLFITTITCILLFSSCERVIDVDLNSASPKYVIEGSITDAPGPHKVRITQTKNFDENNTFEGISNAEVTITDNAGNTETLAYTDGGEYQTVALEGVPGRTYSLIIRVAGNTFTAESTMPGPVSFDSLYVEEFKTFGESFKIPYVRYSDPPGIRNFYRHILYINNARAQSIYIGTDERKDGLQIERALPYFRGSEEDRLKAGDAVRVEVQVIERAVYDYFFSLDQTIDQDAATPANPISNIRGGALGYFSAHSEKTKTIVVE